MTPRHEALLEQLLATAREHMTAAELRRFEAEVRQIFRYRPKRDPRQLAREHLLERHCPAALPAITIDRPTKPLAAKRAKPPARVRPASKQMRLPL